MKLVKVLVAALVMTAMAVPVIAEDRLSLSGEMRVRGWYTDNGFDDYINSLNVATKDSKSTQTWADQRFRLGGTIAVAEGVSITFRTDITESNWGKSDDYAFGQDNGAGSGRSGADQQWDRAHIDLTKGNFHLRAGQQTSVYGKTYALDTQDNGFSADYKLGGGSLNALFYLDNDNGSKDEADGFVTGLKYSGKADNLSFDVFAGNYKQNGNVSGSKALDADVYLVGANVTVGLDAITLLAELDYFTGDSSSVWTAANAPKASDIGDVRDAYGLQFMLDGSLKASDALKVGGQFFYGAGDDEDVQYTGIGNRFNGWDPIFDIGTSLSNEQIVGGSPFNVATVGGYEGVGLQAASAGAIGGRLYTNYKASDNLSMGASVGYFQSEEDKIADIDYIAAAAGLVYKVMANTSLQLQMQYTDGTVNETDYVLMGQGDKDFDSFRVGTGLFVTF